MFSSGDILDLLELKTALKQSLRNIRVLAIKPFLLLLQVKILSSVGTTTIKSSIGSFLRGEKLNYKSVAKEI